MLHRLLLFLLPLALVAADGVVCTNPYINISDRCIYIDPWQTGTMEQVRASCKTHNGDILWFDNDEDCDFYRDLLTHISENHLNEKDFWIGVTDEGHEGLWRYLKTNTEVRHGPPYWYLNNPVESTTMNCAYLNKTHQYWLTIECTKIFSTICRM